MESPNWECPKRHSLSDKGELRRLDTDWCCCKCQTGQLDSDDENVEELFGDGTGISDWDNQGIRIFFSKKITTYYLKDTWCVSIFKFKFNFLGGTCLFIKVYRDQQNDDIFGPVGDEQSVCWRRLTYADVCWRMLMYAGRLPRCATSPTHIKILFKIKKTCPVRPKTLSPCLFYGTRNAEYYWKTRDLATSVWGLQLLVYAAFSY